MKTFNAAERSFAKNLKRSIVAKPAVLISELFLGEWSALRNQVNEPSPKEKKLLKLRYDATPYSSNRGTENKVFFDKAS